MLLVPLVPGQDWTTETLRQVLMETLDLAKLRAVDPALLGAAPSTCLASISFNAAGHAVSTDVARPDAQGNARRCRYSVSYQQPASGGGITWCDRRLTVTGSVGIFLAASGDEHHPQAA